MYIIKYRVVISDHNFLTSQQWVKRKEVFMLIVKIDSASKLCEYFQAYNRDQYECKTYEGLIEYFDSDDDIELDVIAICCDLKEANYKEVCRDYNLETEDVEEADIKDIALQFLNDNTIIIAEGDDFVSYWSF